MADNVVVKKEPGDSTDAASRIIELCEANPVGISDKLLQAAMPDCSVQDRVAALNNLIAKDKIEILQQKNQLIYKLKSAESSKLTKGTDNEEKIVLKIVEKAGNKGIWIRDIRVNSGLSDTRINKVLKSLESKRLVKKVSAVNASKKKVYMLYDLEPDRTITGGAWYSDNAFESEFVDVLNEFCFRYLNETHNSNDKIMNPVFARNASFRSSTDIWKHIKELKLSKVDLSVEDIETILNTLIYDGKIEKKVVSSGSSKGEVKSENLYRVINPIIPSAGLMRMPCGVCSVYRDCCEGGIVSPSTCLYMKEWLEF